jgi:hypothetical protein
MRLSVLAATRLRAFVTETGLPDASEKSPRSPEQGIEQEADGEDAEPHHANEDGDQR